jgi:hypothetical protein
VNFFDKTGDDDDDDTNVIAHPATKARPARGGLPVIDYENIQPCLDVLDFVEGLVIEGSAGVVYGDSNCGKTFWTTDLALHIAAGLPWCGREVDQGGVIYCVLEGSRSFANRVSAWRMAHPGNVVHFKCIPSSIDLLRPDADTPALIQAIKDAAATLPVPVRFVVVDTLSRALAGGDENSPEDMGALVMNMDRIRAETGAALWFVHHCGKDAARGARGHSSLRAAIDTEIEVSASDITRSAAVVKQRDLEKGDAFPFALTVVELGINRRGKPVTSCVVDPAGAGALRPLFQDMDRAVFAAVFDRLRSLKHAVSKQNRSMPLASTMLVEVAKRTPKEASIILRLWVRDGLLSIAETRNKSGNYVDYYKLDDAKAAEILTMLPRAWAAQNEA